jgi:ribA/ribD-fused uncharacterized protein
MQDTQHIEQLRQRFNAGEKLKYVFFWGHHSDGKTLTASCFSQWYPAPFTAQGQQYATAEHYMMAEKARLFGDHAIRASILDAPNPGAAKALGRQVRGFDEAVWLEHRFAIVVQASEAKFTQNPQLHQFLQQTGSRILVEASPTDRVWGIGLTAHDAQASNPNQWRGLNLLGFALMQVRHTGSHTSKTGD